MQSPCETELCQYHYDALDRLIANVLQCKPLHKRFYCKSRLATEIQGANRYSMFQHGDQLLAQQQSEGDAPNATLLATDQQRSVLHTLKANHPRRPIAYMPYGHRSAENGLLSLLGFNGEHPDPVTGHYLLGNGYRAFNPGLMRFNSPDSWSPFGRGGLNSYVYCLGDPINRFDVTGHTSNLIANQLTSWARRASTRIVARTNRIMIDGHAYKLAPGVSPAEAVEARARMDKLDFLGSTAATHDAAYVSALHSERVMARENWLQKMAINIIQSESIPTHTLPAKLQELVSQPTRTARHALLEHIKNSHVTPRNHGNISFSHEKLFDLTNVDFPPSIPRAKDVSADAAWSFRDELMDIRNPNSRRFREESRRISSAHFIY